MPTPANRYDRQTFGEGVLGWVYEYFNPAPIARPDALATGLEIGVQLTGEWFHRGSFTSARQYGPGEAHLISPAERYAISFQASPAAPGVQVGFIVYPDEVPGLADGDHDLRFAPDGMVTRSLWDLCNTLRRANDRGDSLREADVRREVLAFVNARVEQVPADPFVRAKREIDRSFASALYVEHVAEVAGMHPRRFSRGFAARFGITPVAYRLRLRLNEAARLTWSARLTNAEIAARVGFTDLPYFFRAFQKEFGVTPQAYGRRARPSEPVRAAS